MEGQPNTALETTAARAAGGGFASSSRRRLGAEPVGG